MVKIRKRIRDFLYRTVKDAYIDAFAQVEKDIHKSMKGVIRKSIYESLHYEHSAGEENRGVVC